MRKTTRQLDREIAETLSGRSQPRSSTIRHHATKKTDTNMNDLNEALRHYAWLSEAATLKSPGRTPEAWDAVAARIEAGVKAVGLTGDYRAFALDRAKDARSNARFLKLLASRGSN